MIACPYCGLPNIPERQTCKRCGGRLRAPAPPRPTPADDELIRLLHECRPEQLPLVVEKCTREIERNPRNAALAYYCRAQAYARLGDLPSCVLDLGRQHACSAAVSAFPTPDPALRPLFDTLRDHVNAVTWPRLRRSGERLVSYWPGELRWGADPASRDPIIATSPYGRYGIGYVCLTDRAVHLVTVGDLSRRFAVAARARLPWPSVDDPRAVERSDRSGSAPYQSLAVEPVDDLLLLVTLAETWALALNPDHLPLVLTAIEMGIAGRLARIWQPVEVEQTERRPTESRAAKTLALLEQLRALRAAGVITEAEFEVKQRQLLAQLR